MADNKKLTRKQARKLAEKESKRRRKEEQKVRKKTIKEEKKASGRRSGKRASSSGGEKKKVRIKKRFFVFIAVFALAAALIVFCAVKIITNVMGPAGGDKDETPPDPNSVEAVVNVNEVYDSADPALMYSPVGDDSEGQSDEGKKDDDSDKSDDTADVSKYSIEYKICSEIISNWQISPLTQTEEVVAQSFGELTRYEEWGGGIYYHKGFPETMYVSYGGNVIDNKPQSDAICDAVSVCLKSIIQFDEFTPNTSVWGEIHEDKSGEGWTDYFYSLLIKQGVNLIVYCDEDGTVDQETHIIVRKV